MKHIEIYNTTLFDYVKGGFPLSNSKEVSFFKKLNQLNYKINNAHTLHKYSLCVPSSCNLSDKYFNKIVNICKKIIVN